VKAGWPTRTLIEVCEIRPPKIEARRKVSGEESVSFVPMEDLGIDCKYLMPKQTRLLADVVGSYTYFADGDVLLAKITPCFENGKLGIATDLVNGIGFGSSEYFVFRPNSTLTNEWLYYFLSRETFRNQGAERMSGAVGQKRVEKEFIETYPIPIPPVPDQQRIVRILDEVFDGLTSARTNIEKNLQNVRALFESHLKSVFSDRAVAWPKRKLGDISEVQSGGTPSVAKKEYWKGDIPWYSSGELNNLFTTEPERHITSAGLHNSNAKLFPRGVLTDRHV
jgi:type I restriction enzyme, S subunit